MKSYSAQDKYGRYTLAYHDRILTSEVIGAIGRGLTIKFNSDMMTMFSLIEDKPFGYLGDLSQCQAYTADAEKLLYISHHDAIKSGCVVDAYCVGTALSIEQLRRVRQNAGIETPLEDHIFPSLQDARAYINLVLSKVDKANS